MLSTVVMTVLENSCLTTLIKYPFKARGYPAILPAVRKSPSGEFELRPTFGKIFIVIDRPKWSEDGVLVVCRYEETTGALGLGIDAADSRQIGWMPMIRVRPVFSTPALSAP